MAGVLKISTNLNLNGFFFFFHDKVEFVVKFFFILETSSLPFPQLSNCILLEKGDLRNEYSFK